MSDCIKKISTYDYLTWINKKGEVCPRMPKDWKDEEKYGKDYVGAFMNAICIKLNFYEEYYKNPLLMISEIVKLRNENERLTKENDRLIQELKKEK